MDKIKEKNKEEKMPSRNLPKSAAPVPESTSALSDQTSANTPHDIYDVNTDVEVAKSSIGSSFETDSRP